MVKKIFYNEETLIEYLRSKSNTDPIYTKPERYPCMLVDEIYRHAGNGNYIRTLDLLYPEDVKGLFNQLEVK